jgi:hypothetical protein
LLTAGFDRHGHSSFALHERPSGLSEFPTMHRKKKRRPRCHSTKSLETTNGN